MEDRDIILSESLIAIPVYEVSNEITTSNLPALRFDDIKSMGSSMAPFLNSVNSLGSPNKTYKVVVPKDAVLMKTKDGRTLATIVDSSSKRFKEHVGLQEVPFDPTSLAIAIALNQVIGLLEDIKSLQEEILGFLQLQEMAKQKGNLKVLNDIHKNLQFNWNNEVFKINKHIQVQEIKRDAEKSVVLYRELIKKSLSKGSLITNNAMNAKVIDTLEKYFNEYHSNLYLVSLSSLLELMLLDSVEPKYIQSVREGLIEDSYNYRELYTNAHVIIEKRVNGSIETQLIDGFAGMNKLAGKAISKVPLINKGLIDEKLIENSSKIKEMNIRNGEKRLSEFAKHRNVGSKIFIDSLLKLQKVYSEDIELIVSGDNIYIAS